MNNRKSTSIKFNLLFKSHIAIELNSHFIDSEILTENKVYLGDGKKTSHFRVVVVACRLDFDKIA